MRDTSVSTLHDEPLIDLTEAASRFPGQRGAARLHPATLTRWILKGSKGVNGQRVKLEALRMGSRWLTSAAALARFANALHPAGDSQTETPLRTPAARNQASEAAGAQLDQFWS
jgi:hypothetical protein